MAMREVMSRYKPREKGDRYRPTIIVHKSKNGIPTNIEIGGNRYALIHSDYINGAKNKVGK